MSDFDNPWKDVLEHFLRQFLEFFFPEAHAAIDWGRRYESLDKDRLRPVRLHHGHPVPHRQAARLRHPG